MLKLAATLALASVFCTACAGEIADPPTAVAPADAPAPSVVDAGVTQAAALQNCCVPYALCDQLVQCDSALVTLCRQGIDPSNGQCGHVGFTGCEIPMSWCAADSGR